MDDKEPFLSRWSRRKLDAKEDAPGGAPPATELPSAAPLVRAKEPAAPGLPTPDTPEYREFFDPQVDEKLRQTALRKLFSDPRFNIMDGLDTYIDDYSKPDSIPEVMLRQLNQAKALFLFDDERQASESASDEAAAAAGGAGSAAHAASSGTATSPEPPVTSASDDAAAAATNAAAVPPREANKNA